MIRAIFVGVAVGTVGALLALPRLELAWVQWTARSLRELCFARYAPIEVVLWGIVLCVVAGVVAARLGGRTNSARLTSALVAVAITFAATLAIDATVALSIDIGTGRGGAPYGLVEACP